MYDCWMLVFTAMSGVGACVAVVVALIIYRRQKNIALFDRRVKILNDFEHFLFDMIPDWEWDGNSTMISKFTKQEISTLFDNSYVELQSRIIKDADECDTLMMGLEGAKKHGEWNGKSVETIEQEKANIINDLQELFKKMRNEAYKKWLAI